MLLKIALGIMIIAAVSVAAAGIYYRAFSKVSVSEEEIGPYHIIYRDLEGVSSKAIQQIKIELGNELAGHGIGNLASFDIFYPEASGIPNRIGFEVSEADAKRAENLDGLKTHRIEAGRYLTAEFPYKGPPSYILAALKVDPAFKAHRNANEYGEAFAAMRFLGDAIFCLQPIVRKTQG